MHLSHLGTVFIFIAQESPTFYLINSTSPVFQVHTCTVKLGMKNLSTVRVTCDTTEAVNYLENNILLAFNVWSFWSSG
jgi:hypothetical protein